MNTEAPVSPSSVPRNLPSYASYMTSAEFTPAETDTGTSAGTPTGGPVLGYIRWSTAGSVLPSTAVVTNMTMMLKVTGGNVFSGTPEIHKSSPFVSGSTSTYWTAGTLNYANRPSYNAAAVGGIVGVTPNNRGRIQYNAGTYYSWDITAGFNTAAQTDYAFTVLYNSLSGDHVLWPFGPNTGGTSGNSPGDTKAPRFYPAAAPASTGYTGAATPAENRPLLHVVAAAKALPTVSLQTSPIIDALRKRVYMLSGNTVFGIDYSSTTNWADSGASPTTTFVVTRRGDRNSGAASGFGPVYPPTSPTTVVDNLTTPLMSYDAKYLFVLDRYPLSGNYIYSLNRLALPLRTDNIAAYDPTKAAASGQAGPGNYSDFNVAGTRDAANNLTLSFFNDGGMGEGVFFGLPHATNASQTGSIFQLTP
jgi:hypothetical protein